MIAVDTNILVYANREESALHAAALRALRNLAEGDEAWAIPVFCVGEFLRVISHDRLFDPPTPMLDDRYLRLLRSLLEESSTRGNLVFDAQIAAVCLEHGATTLLTEDRDFARFRNLKPLTLGAYLGC